MGQYDILDFLDANAGRWFSTREIAENLGSTKTNTSRGLHRLMRYGLVRFRYILIKDKMKYAQNQGYGYSPVMFGHRITEYSSRKTIDKEEREVKYDY